MVGESCTKEKKLKKQKMFKMLLFFVCEAPKKFIIIINIMARESFVLHYVSEITSNIKYFLVFILCSMDGYDVKVLQHVTYPLKHGL